MQVPNWWLGPHLDSAQGREFQVGSAVRCLCARSPSWVDRKTVCVGLGCALHTVDVVLLPVCAEEGAVQCDCFAVMV